MKPLKKIIGVHLLNDYSGSPLVFSQTLLALQKEGHEIVLHTSNPASGFLNTLNVEVHKTPYKFYSNNLIRLTIFLMSQFVTFFQLLRYRKEDVIIYVNTLLPFGAALAGKLIGKPVVYHLHETSIRPLLLLNFLRKIAAVTATRAIYVSAYLYNELPLKGVESIIIYNAVPEDFEKITEEFKYSSAKENFIVLMVCSLKRYKGIYEFIDLARRHPALKFEMVVNVTLIELKEFFAKELLPENLHLYSIQKNLHPFYQRASIVVNLTNPGLCVETFGMTLLEAMCYGIPVIAPPVGGPAELVQNGENGYTVDVRDGANLDKVLIELSGPQSELLRLSANAKRSSERFSSKQLRLRILNVFGSIAT